MRADEARAAGDEHAAHRAVHLTTASAPPAAARGRGRPARRASARERCSAAVATSSQGAKCSQMRSVSPFDMPDRSAAASATSAPPASSQTPRSRSRASPATAAGPTASANAAERDDEELRVGPPLRDAREVLLARRLQTLEPVEPRREERAEHERDACPCPSDGGGRRRPERDRQHERAERRDAVAQHQRGAEHEAGGEREQRRARRRPARGAGEREQRDPGRAHARVERVERGRHPDRRGREDEIRRRARALRLARQGTHGDERRGCRDRPARDRERRGRRAAAEAGAVQRPQHAARRPAGGPGRASRSSAARR